MAPQPNVGFEVNCGSGRRALETTLLTDAVEKGKNELIKVFTYARVETVIS